MKKIYLLVIFIGLVCVSFTTGIQAQVSTPQEQEKKTIQNIEGLRVFQSSATRDILYVTSDLGLTKTVTIYTVLGKKVFFKVLIGTELDISNLNRGIYVIKVKEADKFSTKKLIIN